MYVPNLSYVVFFFNGMIICDGKSDIDVVIPPRQTVTLMYYKTSKKTGMVSVINSIVSSNGTINITVKGNLLFLNYLEWKFQFHLRHHKKYLFLMS